MVWPFSRKNGHVEPKDDDTSLGRLLVDNGLISRDELNEALAFKSENADYMLGQALVVLELVDKGIVDAMLLIQDARRNRGDVAEVVDFAVESSKKVERAHEDFRAKLRQMKVVEEG